MKCTFGEPRLEPAEARCDKDIGSTDCSVLCESWPVEEKKYRPSWKLAAPDQREGGGALKILHPYYVVLEYNLTEMIIPVLGHLKQKLERSRWSNDEALFRLQ